MKLRRDFPRLYSLKFTSVAIVSFFLLTNFTGVFFSRVFAPSVLAGDEAATIPSDIPTSGDPDLDWIIFRAGEREAVDPRFIHAVIWQESKYDNSAVSRAGARGLMQLMPATARRFGCKNANDATANVDAGAKYLGWLLKRFAGNVELALAGYNAGEGAVDKYKGVPPYNQTRNYVHKIASRYGKTYHPVLSPEDAKLAFHLLLQDGPQARAWSTSTFN
jgi:Transglycosylase SLT domain